MSVTVTAGTAATSSGTGYNLIAPTLPSSAAGNLLVAVIEYDTSLTVTAPSGWTLIPSRLNDYRGRVAVYTAPGASNPGTTWTQSSTYPVASWGQIYCVSNGTETVSVDTHAITTTFNTTAPKSPSVTTTAANDVIFSIIGGYKYGVTNAVPTEPSGYTFLGGHDAPAIDKTIMGVAWTSAPTVGATAAASWSVANQLTTAAGMTLALSIQTAAPTVSATTTPTTVVAPASVTLDATATFASGHTGTYAWTAVTSGAPAITSGASSASATISNTGSPSVETDYVYQVVVTQDDNQTATAQVTLHVYPAAATALVTGGTMVGSSGTAYLNIVPDIPANTAKDVLVAVIRYDRSRTITVPSGWTLQNTADDIYRSITAIYTAPGASGPGNVWTHSGTTAPNIGRGQVFVVSSLEGKTVSLDSVVVGGTALNSTTVTGPAVTTIQPGEVLLSVASVYAGFSSNTLTASPSDYTLLTDNAASYANTGIAWATASSTPGVQTTPEYTFASQFTVGRTITVALFLGTPPPSVTCGADQAVKYHKSATLTATHTLASGHTATIAWTAVTSGAPAITSGANTLSATIADSGATYLPATYTYQVTVTQDDNQTVSDTMTLTVSSPTKWIAKNGNWAAVHPTKRAKGGSWV